MAWQCDFRSLVSHHICTPWKICPSPCDAAFLSSKFFEHFLPVLLLLSIYNTPSVNLVTGVAYMDVRTDVRGSGGRRGRTCADQLRARAKGEGVARRAAYGGRPSHNLATLDSGLLLLLLLQLLLLVVQLPSLWNEWESQEWKMRWVWLPWRTHAAQSHCGEESLECSCTSATWSCNTRQCTQSIATWHDTAAVSDNIMVTQHAGLANQHHSHNGTERNCLQSPCNIRTSLHLHTFHPPITFISDKKIIHS